MKKLRMVKGNSITLEEGCNKYLDNCRARNLREGTINHYRQSYLYFYKFFDPKMPLRISMNSSIRTILHLKTVLDTVLSALKKVRFEIVRVCKRQGCRAVCFGEAIRP